MARTYRETCARVSCDFSLKGTGRSKCPAHRSLCSAEGCPKSSIKRYKSGRETDEIYCPMHAYRAKRGIEMSTPSQREIEWFKNPDGYMISQKRIPGRSKRVRYQHVTVVEESLGRQLLPGETVHHKNGVTWDNRLSNLELWVSHQPSGQRPEDLLEWADEIIRRYRDASS